MGSDVQLSERLVLNYSHVDLCICMRLIYIEKPTLFGCVHVCHVSSISRLSGQKNIHANKRKTLFMKGSFVLLSYAVVYVCMYVNNVIYKSFRIRVLFVRTSLRLFTFKDMYISCVSY